MAPYAAEAAGEAARAAAAELVDAPVDLAFLVLSPAHVAGAAAAAEAVRETLAPRHLLACIADGVVAGEEELERGPAVAVWAASLPGATVEPFHARAEAT